MPAQLRLALSNRALGVLFSVLLSVTLAISAAPSTPAAATPRADGRYIVTLKTGTRVTEVLREHAISAAAVTATYRAALHGFAARLPDAVAARLAADPDVLRIQPDRIMRIAATQTSPPWGLDRSDQRGRALSKSYTYGTTGKGVTAYVLDTGIRATHADFSGRVLAGYNATNYYLDPTEGDICTPPANLASTADDHGHGTHVAGTLGGSTYGIAKGVTLVPVKVMDCNGYGHESNIIEGLEWAIRRHTAGTPAVANISLGAVVPEDQPLLLDEMVRAAVADGITMTVAAGNAADDACGYSPARVPEVLTVAASDKEDRRASWSNYGRCVDLFAPGADIVSAGHRLDTSVRTLSGTSMAAPHVAGAAARHLQARPSASPAAITRALLADTTSGVISGRGTASPNLLLYAGRRPTSLSVATSRRRITYGTSVTVKGRLVTADGGGVKGRPLKLQRRRAGTTTWANLTTVATSSTGRASFTHEPHRTFAYRFVHRRSADYAYSRSPARTVGVRTRVTAKLTSTTVNRGGKAALRGAVRPRHAGQRVVLQRYGGGAWRNFATSTLNRRSRYYFRLPNSRSGKVAYRVLKPRDVDHLPGVSGKRVLTVR